MRKNGKVFVMGKEETRVYSSMGEKGATLRREIRSRLQALADRSGRAVELYASASAGGWMAEQFYPDSGPRKW